MNLDQFKKYLIDSDPDVRKKAIMALAKSNYAKKLDLLIPLSENDPLPEIRDGVKKIIVKLTGEAGNSPVHSSETPSSASGQKKQTQVAPPHYRKEGNPFDDGPLVIKLSANSSPDESLLAEIAENVESIMITDNYDEKLNLLYKFADGEVGYKEYPAKHILKFLWAETDHKLLQKGLEFVFKEGTQDIKTELLKRTSSKEFNMPKDILIERIGEEMDYSCLAEMIKVMGDIGSDDDLVLITKHLVHADDRVRCASIAALRKMGNEFAHEYVLPMLNDKDETDEVKAKAAAFVFEKDRESAMFMIEEMLEKAKDKYTSKTVITCLEEINNPFTNKLLASAKEKFNEYNKKDVWKEANQIFEKKKK